MEAIGHAAGGRRTVRAMTVAPPPHVLDLFAVPADVQPLPGGQGGSVRAGDLVLSPGRDPEVAVWLNPLLARLAVELDERTAARRSLRVAMPIPARDGSWVVEGWGASRWETGTTGCDDAAVVVATARLLHAELAVAVPVRPAGLERREDRWALAERLAFGEDDCVREAVHDHPARELVERLVLARSRAAHAELGDDQLVHADLTGNVLLDPAGSPVVIDVSPAWRPALWAEAVCRLDLAVRDPERRDPHEQLGGLAEDARGRSALARAALFRLLSDRPVELDGYERALVPLLGTVS